MRRFTLPTLILALLIVVGVAAYLCAQPAPLQEPTPTAAIGAPFMLTDQNGRTVTDADFRGKLLLVEFGYTLCPDICPQQLELMRAALDKLPAPQAAQVAPLFVSLDPARDTPAHLRDYLQSFNKGKSPAITGLTGPLDAIDALAKSYHIYYQRTTQDGFTRIDHSVTIFLMDAHPNSQLASPPRFVQSFTMPTPDELADGITHALQD